MHFLIIRNLIPEKSKPDIFTKIHVFKPIVEYKTKRAIQIDSILFDICLAHIHIHITDLFLDRIQLLKKHWKYVQISLVYWSTLLICSFIRSIFNWNLQISAWILLKKNCIPFCFESLTAYVYPLFHECKNFR